MAPSVKLHFFAANDVNGSLLHEITDEDDYFKSLKLKVERDGLGGAELLLARTVGFSPFASGTFRAESFVRLIIPAYSSTTYYPWGFFLNKRQQVVVHVDEKGGEEFKLGGPGPKQYLARHALGIETQTSQAPTVDLENGVWRWNENATVGRILNKVLDEDAALNNPSLPDLTWTFDNIDDSDSVNWIDDDIAGPGEFEVPIGTDFLKLLWDLDDFVQLTSWVDLGTVASPKFELNIIQGLGDDNTGSAFGAGVCLLKEGENIADDAVTVEGASLRQASHVLVEGKDGVWVQAVRTGYSPGDYTKREKISFTRTSNEAWLEAVGKRWLDRQDNGEKEITIEIVPGQSDAAGSYFPAPDRVLWLSNLISVETAADGTSQTALDLDPSDAQLVTGFELDTHQAADDANSTALARSWDVKVKLNVERSGNVQKTPDQRSTASGGGSCKCLKLCPHTDVLRGIPQASLKASGEQVSGPAPKSNANDGDDVSTWGSGEGEPSIGVAGEWWAADLGSVHEVDGFRILQNGGEAPDVQNVATNVHVMVSTDGADWSALPGSGKLASDPAWELAATYTRSLSFGDSGLVAFSEAKSARYVLFRAHAGGTLDWDVETFELWSNVAGEGLAAPCGHTHNHPLLSTSGTHHHDSDDIEGGGGGAPTTADYLVGTANGSLSAEIVVGTTPGGELGGTWASPTVDATHSGSTHSAATDTHIADTTDAHDASAISIADAGGLYTGTEVEAALQEIGAHPADTSDAHDASAVSVADAGGFYTGTDVEAVLQEVGPGLAAGLLGNHTHTINGTGATGGGGVLNVPDLEATGLFKISGVITSTVDANQNDYNPTGIHTNGIIRFTSFTANRTITGLNAGTDGEMLIILNNTGFSLTLPNESASSSALNRFRTAGGVSTTVRTSGCVWLIYLAGRWTTFAI